MLNSIIIGNQIQRARKKSKMTQQQMAEKIGTNEKYVSNIETGKSRCSLGLLIDIANLLEVSIDDLLGDNLKINMLNNTPNWPNHEYNNLISSDKEMVKRFIEFLYSDRDKFADRK